MTKSKAYYEGAKAAESINDDQTLDDVCPYKRGTTEWFDWTAGLVRAYDLECLEKLDPDQLTETDLTEWTPEPEE